MAPTVLLAATATSWLGTARIPRTLSDAGFGVALLAPRGSLALASRHLVRVGVVETETTPAQWIERFAAMVAATAPRLVIPCDDMAFRLLAHVVNRPADGEDSRRQLRLAALIRSSLGDPAFDAASVDKTQLPALAASLGVALPEYLVVDGVADAEPFVARHGWPVVLKRAHGFAGQGVAICRSRDELAGAFAAFRAADAREPSERGNARYLLQQFVAGTTRFFHAAAWEGELRAGFALEKLESNPAPTGPPTVTRYFPGDDLRRISATLARALGISGLFFAEFIVDPQAGKPLLVEVNRRVSPATHRGALRRVDLCAALHSAVTGTPPQSRPALDAGEEGISVHFPQEWLRDPESPYLARFPSDVPWDEPELLEAMLGMRD